MKLNVKQIYIIYSKSTWVTKINYRNMNRNKNSN